MTLYYCIHRFKPGDRVKCPSFTDCFGVTHPEVANLIVTEVYTDGGNHPHVRVLTNYASGEWEGFRAMNSPQRMLRLA